MIKITIQPVQPTALVLPNGYVQQYQQPYQHKRSIRGLSFLVHALAKQGKSTFAATVPAPRIILDAESGSFWAAGRSIDWNPSREPVPQPPDRRLTAGYGQPSLTPEWESAMVAVHNADVVADAYRVLNTGMHPFNGLSLDSFTEVQQRVIDHLAGTKQLTRDQWGALLRQITHMSRQFRDLITHPVKPLWGICFIAGTHWDERAQKWRPLLQGGSSDFVPYYPDVLGYLEAAPDGKRHMLIGPHPRYETGERVGGRLPMTMIIGDGRQHPGYTMESMIQQVLTGRS
jgi:hypothetical protein